MIAECARGQFAAMVFSLVAYLVASPGVRAQEAPDYAALVVAPDRSDADWKAGKRRDPVPFLAFAGCPKCPHAARKRTSWRASICTTASQRVFYRVQGGMRCAICAV